MAAAPTAAPGQPLAPETRRWGVARTITAILGSLSAVGGAALLVAGFFLLAIDRDTDGFFSTSPETFETDTYALSTGALEIDAFGPGWLYGPDTTGEIRIEGQAEGSNTALFLGIGPTDAVSRYLAGVGHDRLGDFEVRPFDASYERVPGGAPASAPGTQTFWVADDSGSSPSVTWDVSSGDWSVVVMNADGSAEVQSVLSVGATLPIVRSAGLGIVIAGGLALVIGIAMVVAAVMIGRKRTEHAL